MNRYTSRTFILEAVMVLVGILFFIPVYLLINLSLKRPDDQSSPMAPVTNITFENFTNAWERANLGQALLTSTFVTIFSVLIIVLISALAAYPLARVTKNWSKWLFFVFMIGLLLPFQLALIPLYTTMRDLGLLGNPISLVLFYAGQQVPFSVFLYTGFIRAVPLDYEEAAAIDGAGPIKSFISVIFPLVRPITGTVIILNVLHVWNDFLTPLLYLSGSSQQTVPVALFSFVSQYVSEWNLVFAGLVITTAPILIMYFAMQKTIIKGFASGLKG